jgi:hypothetical protein
MIFADVRLRGVMDGIDLVKMRWPLLPVILTSGHPRERVGASARRRLHAQAVAATQRSDCRRTGVSVCASRLILALKGVRPSRDLWIPQGAPRHSLVRRVVARRSKEASDLRVFRY